MFQVAKKRYIFTCFYFTKYINNEREDILSTYNLSNNSNNYYNKKLFYKNILFRYNKIYNIFSFGTNSNIQKYNDMSLFSLASLYKEIYVLKLLLKYDYNINLKNYVGYTILHNISYSNSALSYYKNIIKFLLKNNIHINLGDMFNLTVLHYAVYENNIVMTTLFLKYGANPFIKNKWGDNVFDVIKSKHNSNNYDNLLFLLNNNI